MRSTGQYKGSRSMLVDYHDFGNGNTILVFDLTATSECNSEQFTVRKLENVRINLKYSNALTETNNLILYGEFDGVLQNDANRNVVTDYLKNMNSGQLCWILSGDKFTKLSVKGFHAIDEMKLIKSVSYPSCFVINLDPSYKPGSHWVAVYFDRNDEGEYSDSFARYPPHKVDHFLCSHAKGWQYNRMQVQEIYTTTCGQFVVFYIYQKSLCLFFFYMQSPSA